MHEPHTVVIDANHSFRVTAWGKGPLQNNYVDRLSIVTVCAARGLETLNNKCTQGEDKTLYGTILHANVKFDMIYGACICVKHQA